MEHIRQIDTETYTVINLNGYEGDLDNHPTITEYPELFEISEDEIPENAQYLNPVIKTKLETEIEKQLKRRQDGILITAQITAEYKIAVSLGYVSEEQNRISTEELIPVNSFIQLGEWKFAKSKLIEIGSLIIGETLYDKLLEVLNNYIDNNY